VIENYESVMAIQNLREEASALSVMCKRYPIVKARYIWFVMSTENFVISNLRRKSW
jgi:hypothetical protein